jgi:hypothetical protein
MPKFFFHMATKGHQVTDKIGRTLDSLSDAHTHAVDLIYRSCAHLEPKDTEGWMINVADASGRSLLIVLFPRRLSSRSWRSYYTHSAAVFGEAARGNGWSMD